MLGYQIDFDPINMYVNRMELESQAATAIFFSKARPLLSTLVVETIAEVAPTAGKGFPPAYTQHLISVASANPPIRVIFGGLQVDLEMLGTYEDYTRGFHRHARTQDGMVELPWTEDQEPKNDYETRLAFWTALVDGVPFKPKQGQIDTTGMYDETIQNRVEVWGNLAPEWWVLQNGSPTYPESQPTALSELMAARVEEVLFPLWEQSLIEAEARAEANWGTKPSGSLFNNLRGGNPLNTGQFSPRT
jgi:hypothetical protein